MRLSWLCLLLAADVIASTPLVDRYSTLAFRESPYAPHLGVRRLGAEEAAKRNHYRFEYDSQGRISRISFALGERLREPNHTANYFWYASVEHYRYQDQWQIVSYRDLHDQPMAVHGEVFESRYQLDPSGRRISLQYLGANGQPVESAWGVARYQWQHLDDGSVIEQRFDLDQQPVSLRPGFPFQRVRLSYDARGRTLLLQNIDASGSPQAADNGFAQDRFTYTAHGELARYEVLDAQGGQSARNMQGIAAGLVRFTERGYEHIASYLDGDGRPAYNDNGWWRSERRYDDFGNLILNAFADQQGARALNPNTGYAELRIGWHDDGLRRRELAYFDAQGQPVEHQTRGMHAVRYGYDSRQRLMLVYLVDRHQQLVEHAQQGWAMTRYQYQGDSAVGTPQRLSLAEALAAERQHILSLMREHAGVPGVAAAVAEDGERVWHGETGYADLVRRLPVQVDTQFRLASVSKAVTAILVAEALDRGQIALADRASDWLRLEHPATLAQLLAHSGSIDHYNPLISVDLDRSYDDVTAALAVVRPHLLPMAPGSRYRYSTFGYSVIGAMLEAASGRRFAELLHSMGERQGLASLATSAAEAHNPKLTRFYQLSGGDALPAKARNFSYADPGAGIIASASDLAVLVCRFASARLVSAEQRDRMLQVQRLSDGQEISDQRYQIALGWRRQADLAGRPFFHHGGVTDGARSVVLFDPADGRSVAILSNAAWTSDVFGMALSLLAARPAAASLDLLNSGSFLLSHAEQALPLGDPDCREWRCKWRVAVSGELADWLGRAAGKPELTLELGLLGGRIYTPYGVAPLAGDQRGMVAAQGSRHFRLTFAP